MTMEALFKEDKKKLVKGMKVSLNKGLVDTYHRLDLVGARVHTVLEKAVQILTTNGEYVMVHMRSGRPHAWTLNHFNIN